MQLPALHSLQRLRRTKGSVLLELAMAFGLATFIAVFSLRASLLAIASNQWTVMQSLTDAYMTGETALATRIPFNELTAANNWPDLDAAAATPVTIGFLPNLGTGARPSTATLTRYSIRENAGGGELPDMNLVRLISVLRYDVGDQVYYKTRTTVRTQ